MTMLVCKVHFHAIAENNSEEENIPSAADQTKDKRRIFDANNFKMYPLNPNDSEWQKTDRATNSTCAIPQYGNNTPPSYYQQDPACNYKMDLLRVDLR